MGTDIHGVWQNRKAIDGVWRDIPSNYTQDRHYQLFAVLAGVRNGYGFAGVQTGEPVIPIAEPRGIPSDFDWDGDYHPIERREVMDPRRQEWAEENEKEIWMGDHSHSWLSGQEMLEWAKTPRVLIACGVITAEEFEAWEGDAPKSYCGGVFGPRLKTVSEADAKRLPKGSFSHVQVTWERKLHEELAYFFDEVKRLVEEYGEIRFVFGFDS